MSSQQAAVTYLGRGTVSKMLAPPVLEMIFSTSFIVDLKAEGGASWRSPVRWYRPSATDFSAGMGSPSSSVPRKAVFDMESITTVSISVSFNF
jgi:hypothetical protein